MRNRLNLSDEDMIFFLEQELLQSLHTIEFLNECLTMPNFARHDYPEQTMDRIEKLKKITKGVYISCRKHSMMAYHDQNCEQCIKNNEIRIRWMNIEKTLGLRN